MPKVSKILLKSEGFQYATQHDLNMGYYHILLSENKSNLCTIIIPWGKYRYKHLPMGIGNPPESSQQKINGLFYRFELICAYMDDLLILTKVEWKDHVQKLKSTLNKLKEKGLKYNTEESFFGQTKMEYLGFWVTRNGVNTIDKNMQEIKIWIQILPEKKYGILLV